MPDESTHSETMVSRVAEALYRHSVNEGRNEIAAKVFPLDKIVDVFATARTASDREASIVIFALADDIVTDFFREKLTGHVPGGVDATMLAGNGMLASAYNKLLLLSGLNWIRRDTYAQLALMRRIRNEFAHHVSYKSFNDAPICDYITTMDDSEIPVVSVADSEEARKQT